MPYATNPQDGVRLHYALEGESGPVLVMQYGFMGYIDAWYEAGYVEGLASEMRLVLFDPRGMEGSDRPHEPELYTTARMATDILALLDAVGAETGHFLGYSRGGRVGYELALRYGERVPSVIIAAMHPYRRAPEDFDEQIEMFAMGWERSMPLHEARHGPLEPQVREQLLRNDSLALAASCVAAQRDAGFDDVLADMVTPTLIYAGERDEQFHDLARAAAAVMPGATFVSLLGLDHGATFFRSELTVPLIRDTVLAG